MNPKKALLAVGLLFVVFCSLYLLSSSSSSGSVQFNDVDVFPVEDWKNGHTIKLAREYQIDLSKFLWKDNRQLHMKEFFNFMNEKTDGVFNFRTEAMIDEGYHRYSYTLPSKSAADEGSKATIRVRDFIKGNRVGLTTVDLKYRNGDTMQEMLNKHASPASDLRETSIQKVEQDVHACDVRWSRGTRLFLDYSPEINTVADVEKLFPDAIDSSEKRTTPIKKQAFDVYYWQSSFSETLPIGLTYKITFTFMYKSLEDAFSGNSLPKKDGEFSIRLFAENKGFSRKFNEEHLRIVNDLFEALLWSDWNVDPDMECLINPPQNQTTAVWRLPVL